MTTDELETLLRDLESDRVERKESGDDRKAIRRAICALANDLADRRTPGVIFLGVDDAGACVGLDITDKLLCTLADMRSSGNLLPMPVMSVEKRELCGNEVVVIEVQPAEYPPVRDDGRTWVRVGPTRRLATVEEEGRLAEKRRRGTVRNGAEITSRFTRRQGWPGSSIWARSYRRRSSCSS